MTSMHKRRLINIKRLVTKWRGIAREANRLVKEDCLAVGDHDRVLLECEGRTFTIAADELSKAIKAAEEL